MKRALFLTLLLSLGANAVFLTRALRSGPTPTATPYPVFHDKRPARDTAETIPTFSATDWSALENASPTAVTFLRQLGLSDPQIRAVVRAEVDARYVDRERALRRPPAYWERTFSPQSVARLEKVTDPAAALALAQQKENELHHILGNLYEPADPALRRLASYLPFEKARQLKRISDDYRLLAYKAGGGGGPLQLPKPRGHAVYLEEQQRADIEALLTPEELRAYDLRTSRAANFLRALAGFNPTEQEFVALYDIRKSAGSLGASREESDRLIEQQTRAFLGEKRYAEYTRAQDPDFRVHHRLARELQLPPENALAGYEYQRSIRAEVAAFAAQSKVTPEETNAFHAELTKEVEATFTRLYGQHGLPAARHVLRDLAPANATNSADH